MNGTGSGHRRGVVLAALSCGLLMIAVLLPSMRGPLAGTEGHRAITGHQMLRDGNWLVPRLFDQTYLRKPPGMYWAIAASERVLGQSEWAWRVPSVLAAAGLAGLLAWAGGRWFGTSAAWVAGLGCVGLVPLWEQSASADIDSLNTFFATAAALGLICLQLLERRRVAVMLLSGLAIGAALLCKGPALLPIVAGAVLGPAVALRRPRLLLRWHVHVAVLLGVLLFVGWVLAASMQAQASGSRVDTEGAEEGLDNVLALIQDPARVLRAVLVPPTLLIYALPVSAGVLLAVQGRANAAGSATTRVLLIALGLGLLACVMSGMVNVRYAYVLLPLLPLILAGSWRPDRRWLAGALVAAALLPVLAGVMGWRMYAQRHDRSMADQAHLLREHAGEGGTVWAGRMILSKPELFWYARVKVASLGQRPIGPEEVPAGALVMLYRDDTKSDAENEWTRWRDLPDLRVLARLDNNGRPALLVRRP